MEKRRGTGMAYYANRKSPLNCSGKEAGTSGAEKSISCFKEQKKRKTLAGFQVR